MIYLKHGKTAVKTFKLCPDRMIYLKTGTYFLNAVNNILCPKVSEIEDIDSLDIPPRNALEIYKSLHVDLGGRASIPLFLNRNGVFARMDGISAKITLEEIFKGFEEVD